MPAATIQNGNAYPLSFQQGTVPNMGETMTDYFQVMTFTTLVTTVVGFESVQTPTATTFWGVLMPYTGRQLALLPEGQRAWNWQMLYAQPVLSLNVDDVVVWTDSFTNPHQVRVMSRKDYRIYSFMEYSVVMDWSGSGP